RRDRRLGEVELHPERVDAVLVLRRDQAPQPRLQLRPALREGPLLHRAAKPAEQPARLLALVADQRLRFHAGACNAIQREGQRGKAPVYTVYTWSTCPQGSTSRAAASSVRGSPGSDSRIDRNRRSFSATGMRRPGWTAASEGGTSPASSRSMPCSSRLTKSPARRASRGSASTVVPMIGARRNGVVAIGSSRTPRRTCGPRWPKSWPGAPRIETLRRPRSACQPIASAFAA